MKVLIDIPEKEYNRIKGKTEVNYSEMWIAEGTPLDGLTNGEVIQTIFPGAKFCCTERLQTAGLPRRDADFDLDFWNKKWGE